MFQRNGVMRVALLLIARALLANTARAQTFVDHLGNVNVIDPRNDIQFHCAMLHFRGWLFSPASMEALRTVAKLRVNTQKGTTLSSAFSFYF